MVRGLSVDIVTMISAHFSSTSHPTGSIFSNSFHDLNVEGLYSRPKFCPRVRLPSTRNSLQAIPKWVHIPHHPEIKPNPAISSYANLAKYATRSLLALR